MRRGQLLTLLLLVGGLLALVSYYLFQTDSRNSFTNNLVNGVAVTYLKPQHRLCQPNERLAGGTAGIRFYIRSERVGQGVFELRASVGGKQIAKGRGQIKLPGEPVNAVVVPLTEQRKDVYGVNLCFINRTNQVVAMMGASLAPPGQALVDNKKPSNGRMRLEGVRAGRENWFELAPTVAQRYSVGKGWFVGKPMFYISILLLVAAIALAFRVIQRDMSDVKN